MFLLKAFVRIVPVAFGAGVLCGAFLMGVACSLAVAGGERLDLAKAAATFGRAGLVGAAALPAAACLLFLLCCLVLDLCRAILGLPANLGKPAEQNQEQPAEKA